MKRNLRDLQEGLLAGIDLLDQVEPVRHARLALAPFGVDRAHHPIVYPFIQPADPDKGLAYLLVHHYVGEHGRWGNLQAIARRTLHAVPGEIHRLIFRFLADHQSHVDGGQKAGRRHHFLPNHARLFVGENHLFILSQTHRSSPAHHFRLALVQSDIVQLLAWVMADRRPTFFSQAGYRIREGHLRRRAGHFKLSRGKVHGSRRDLHGHFRRPGDGIFPVLFHHNQRIRLEYVLGAIRKNNPSHAVAAGLDEISLFQVCVVISPDPFERTRLLDAHGPVEIYEVGLPLGGRPLFIIGVHHACRDSGHGLFQLLPDILGGDQVRNKGQHQRCHQRIEQDGPIGDSRPLHLHTTFWSAEGRTRRTAHGKQSQRGYSRPNSKRGQEISELAAAVRRPRGARTPVNNGDERAGCKLFSGLGFRVSRAASDHSGPGTRPLSPRG